MDRPRRTVRKPTPVYVPDTEAQLEDDYKPDEIDEDIEALLDSSCDDMSIVTSDEDESGDDESGEEDAAPSVPKKRKVREGHEAHEENEYDHTDGFVVNDDESLGRLSSSEDDDDFSIDDDDDDDEEEEHELVLESGDEHASGAEDSEDEDDEEEETDAENGEVVSGTSNGEPVEVGPEKPPTTADP